MENGRVSPSTRAPPPAHLPRWLRSRPFLSAEVLRWLNIHRSHRLLLPSILALLVIGAGALTLPVIGHALELAAQNPLPSFVSLTAACAIATARRKGHLHRSLTDSWLAPLAAPSSMLVRALLPAILQLLALSAGIAIALVGGSLGFAAAVTLWSIEAGAYIVGSGLGWLSRPGKSATAPDFHYVSIRKPRSGWARAPRLEPLSYWTIGQAHVYVKPKIIARAVLLVLLSLPMGITAQSAMAIVAVLWVLLYVGSLMLAIARVAFSAAQWLALTSVGYLRFTYVVGYRALLAQLWIWACVMFLTYAGGLHRPLRAELLLAFFSLSLSGAAVAGAVRVAMRSVGMRSP
jgi:hypothetical protein